LDLHNRFQYSIGNGKNVLLILGVTGQSLDQNGYELKHHQVTILDIYVQEHFDGESVLPEDYGSTE